MGNTHIVLLFWGSSKTPLLTTTGLKAWADGGKTQAMKLNSKGQAGITTILLVVVMLMIGVIIISNVTTAFSSLITGSSAYFEIVYNNTLTNSTSGLNLGSLLPILLGAGLLIGAVMAFARSR